MPRMKALLLHRIPLLLGLLTLLLPVGCARRDMVVEIHGAIMYDKPEIRAVSHVLEDRRPVGGVAVTVTRQGDPGLEATFDISPEIVDRVPGEWIAPFVHQRYDSIAATS